MNTSLATRHHVKTEARVIRSVNMTTSASAPKVSVALTFFFTLYRAVKSLNLAAPRTPNSVKDETFSYQHVKSSHILYSSFPTSLFSMSQLSHRGNKNHKRASDISISFSRIVRIVSSMYMEA